MPYLLDPYPYIHVDIALLREQVYYYAYLKWCTPISLSSSYNGFSHLVLHRSSILH